MAPQPQPGTGPFRQPSADDVSSWPVVMTVDVAAALVGLHEQTLRTWLREGRIRGRRTGRRWHLLRDELVEDLTHVAPPTRAADDDAPR